MKILKISMLLLILFISVGGVCAADSVSHDGLNNDDAADLGSMQSDIALENTQDEITTIDDSTKTFADLQDEINNATGNVLDIKSDYKFDNSTDESNIKITKDNFVINGNNHVIDGNNLIDVFVIRANNVTINNLTIKNAYSFYGSAVFINQFCSLTTNNVIYENNTAGQGVIYINGGAYVSNNDKIIDSVATETSVIHVTGGGILVVNYALMMSSKVLTWGFIQTPDHSPITILNSVFANTTSKYSTAIRAGGNTTIVNSKFINLHAIMTAGAIGIKEIDELIVDNCTFVNVTSEKNGGAIFSDIIGYTHSNIGEVLVNRSTFVNCSSGFGGAILHLGGNFTILNSNFTDNSALFDGGAVYTSNANVVISGSTFNKNCVLYEGARDSVGGAIFFDMGLFELNNSEFTDNSAQKGAALYLYDASYVISDNQFKDNFNFNGSSGDIYTLFDAGITSLDNNNFTDKDSVSQNNTNYATISAGEGMKLVLLNNTIDVSTLPARFDLRDWGWVTPVRNQGKMGSCWTFGSSGAMESAILRYLGLSLDLSENNMQDVSLMYYMYGVKTANEGSYSEAAGEYALSWLGVFGSEYDAYDEFGKISPIIATDNSIHFQDMVIIPPRQNLTDNDALKEAVLKYGGVFINYYAASGAAPEQYYNGTAQPNHGVVLIGWDDNREIAGAPGKGAWIIKNSWGDAVGENGFMYISYYDTAFSTKAFSYAFVLENTILYNKNYQYDIEGRFGFSPYTNEYRNIYFALDDDLIAAVGTYFNDSNVEYNIEIYVNGVLRLAQNGLSPFSGFHTVKLDSYVPVKKGDEIIVKIKSNCVPLLLQSRQHYIPGSSQAFDGEKWINLSDSDAVCSIKMYTVADNTKIINNKDISVDYDGGKYFSVKVVTADGHAVGAGEKVKFTINGKTTTVTTDSNGIAKLKITYVPGSYTIKTTYKGKTYTNKVTVKQVLTTSKFTVKNTAKSFTMQAKLKINGKLVSGKTIKFKLNGKTYAAKTNSKGIAKVTVKQNDIKKLKKGKTYTAQVTYNKDTIKTTVKVQ